MIRASECRIGESQASECHAVNRDRPESGDRGRYTSAVVHGSEASGVLSGDTSRDAERLQVMAWRSMSSVQRAQLVRGAARAVGAMALAGVRQRHPGTSESEIVARLALLTLGSSLALRVCPHLIDTPDAPGD
jgi:hypothetical protein